MSISDGNITNSQGKAFDISELSKLFSTYCQICHVCGEIYDRDGAKLDDFFVPENAMEYYSRRIDEDRKMIIISSFRDFDAENVIAIKTPLPYLCARAVAVRDDEGRVAAVMIIYGIDHEMVHEEDVLPSDMLWTDAAGFEDAAAFLEQLGIHFYREKNRSDSLSGKLIEKDKVTARLEAELRRSDVMTSLLGVLESDSDFRTVSKDILNYAGEYLEVTNAFLLRRLDAAPDEPEDMVDIVSEWHSDDAHPFVTDFGKVSISLVPFWTGRSYTIASDSIMPDSFRTFFRSHGIEAGIFLPVFIHDDVGMCLCFAMRGSQRKWSVEEIRFCNDVRRIMQTVLSRHISRNSLASSYAAIDAILENAGAGICVRDSRDGSVLYENNMFGTMFSDSSDRAGFEKALQDNAEHMRVMAPAESARKKSKIREYYAENIGKWFSYDTSTIKWVDEREVEMCTLFDISQLKKYQRQIEQQADLDDLTGLYNRHRFHKDFEKSIRDAVRSAGQGTLLYLDLDDFNTLNDGLGHVLGDRFLVMAGDALQQIVGGRAQCYRIGGDQFAVLVPYSGADSVVSLVSMIQSRFEKPWRLDDNNYYCTIGIGAVSFPMHGTSEDVLTKRADYALHLAKRSGKNKVEYYGEEEEKKTENKLEMENAMRDAVAEGCREFEVFYQPVVDLSKPNHPCCGAEALVRWDSRKFGFLLPDKFIPLAEYLGLIVPIGEHVLLEACRRCRYWNDFGHPEYRIHVNLSVIQLLQDDIIDVIKKTLDLSGINPGNLTLEVTESLAVNDMQKMKDVLNGIHALGVRLALDDFGTGYSSLNHLKEMPLDVIKIDKCFVNDIGKDEFSDAFIKTVSELAGTLDVNVVVEGVEETKQASLLGDMNVDMIQGYLYDKPLSQLDFERKYLNVD